VVDGARRGTKADQQQKGRLQKLQLPKEDWLGD